MVLQAHDKGLYVQSTWARGRAQAVSAAASCGLISTRFSGSYGRIWRPTTKGLKFLEEGFL